MPPLQTQFPATFLSRSSQPIEWLFRDEFKVDESAPIASPRTSEVGSLTVVQNDGQFSIANGLLDIPAQSTPTWTDLGFYSQALTRSAGLGLFLLLKPTTVSDMPRISFGSAAVAYDSSDVLSLGIYGFEPFDNGLLQRTGIFPPVNAESMVGVILRATGTYYLWNESLLAVGHLANTSSLRAKLVNRISTNKLDYMRVAQLPSPFAEDSLAVHQDATPTANDVADCGQDALHYIQWTPQAAEVFELRFRWVDDDNCMILRWTQSTGVVRLFRREAGVETALGSATQTATVSTTYRIALRYEGITLRAWIVNGASFGHNHGYNSEVTGAKIAGGATLANWEIYPAILPDATASNLARHTNPFLTGSGRTKQTIEVADGGDISAAIATMRAGDTLSLAPNGSYTLGTGVSGFTGLPSGFRGHPTRVLGNGATITGGDTSLSLSGKRHFHIENLNLIDAVQRCVMLTTCRWFTLDGIYADSNVGTTLFDVFRFGKGCRNGTVTNCEAGPSTGWGSEDGFECTDQCGDMTFENCVAHGVVHGFEVWSDALDTTGNWKNYNILWRNCHSYDNQVGYSAEGGPQSLAHVEVVADNCTVENSSEYDYQGVEGATLYIENHTGGTTNGSVTIRS